jgi:glutamate-1-semialdehyde aminotransferase
MSKESKPFLKGSRIVKNNTHSVASLFQKKKSDTGPIHMPVIKRGKGPYLYDYDENRYVDFELSRGSLLLGHAHPQITTVMKSWLTRGYAPGYPVVAHQMLSSKLSSILLRDEKIKGSWLFFNSPFEASAALVSLLGLEGKKKRGLFLSQHADQRMFSPFQSGCIEPLDVNGVKGNFLQDADFVVVRPGRFCDGVLDDIIHRLAKSEILIVSDETDFASHVHCSHYQGLLDIVDMRVFGSYLSSGIPFGCIYVKDSVLFNKEKTMNYSRFKYISKLSFCLPLYSMKAVIKCLGLLQKHGGIGGLLKKSRDFYKMLHEEYFALLDDIIYFRLSEKQKERYGKFRLSLLKSGIYFPLFFDDSIHISYAHSEELLKKSAQKINILFSDFYRRV